VTYSVKELFKTLQGEGGQAGRAAVFCRFTGCNLWSGREEDRAAARCQFCDTDFIGIDGDGGGRFRTPGTLADAIARSWGEQTDRRYVVFTGGARKANAVARKPSRRRAFTIASCRTFNAGARPTWRAASRT
jgi:7-carboxy-7-deazaguanine synthase